MAEQVRQRFVAAKLGVLPAIAGLVGGLTAKARTVFGFDKSSAMPPRHEFVQKVKATIGSRQIIDGSLLARDFEVGQVYSQSQVNRTFLEIDAASIKFLKIDGTAHNALKLDGLAVNSDVGNPSTGGDDRLADIEGRGHSDRFDRHVHAGLFSERHDAIDRLAIGAVYDVRGSE